MDVSYDFVAVSTISRHLGNQINQAFFFKQKEEEETETVVFNLNTDLCLSLTPNFNLILCVLNLTKYIFVKRKKSVTYKTPTCRGDEVTRSKKNKP